MAMKRVDIHRRSPQLSTTVEGISRVSPHQSPAVRGYVIVNKAYLP